MALGVAWVGGVTVPHLLLQTSLSGRNYGDEPVASPQPPQAVVQIQGGNAVKLCSTEMSMRVLKTQPGAGMWGLGHPVRPSGCSPQLCRQ